jgi:hypothetical protein
MNLKRNSDWGSRVRFPVGFTTASRTALGPGALSQGVKWPGREADRPPPSSAEVKECVELYLHSLNTPSWCGAWLITGTILPLPLNGFNTRREVRLRYSKEEMNFGAIYNPVYAVLMAERRNA